MALPSTDFRVHRLKTEQPHFEDVLECRKLFELRKNDRRYGVGDWLLLQEYIPGADEYTGRAVLVKILHILYGPCYGLSEGYVILSIEGVEE